MSPPAADLNPGTPTAVSDGKLGSGNTPYEPDVPDKRPTVLYLFAGPKRKGDMRDHLSRAGRARNLDVQTIEYDVLRHRRQDLTKVALRRTIRTQVEQGKFDMVMASPPCGTFSRARKRDSGPPPLRSEKYPRGLPWLNGKAAASVAQANGFVEFTSTVLRSQLARGGGFF